MKPRFPLAIAAALLCVTPLTLWAQSAPNLELNSDANQDSINAENWDHFFPIWGKKVIQRGIELPLPLGFNVQWLVNSQDMSLGNLKLGVNNRGLVDVSDFIDIGKSTIVTNSAQIRPDVWVLPFLNVYGLFGVGTNTIDVTVGLPVELKTVVDRNAVIAGFGGNVSFAIQRYFVVADGNLTWAKVDGIDEKTRANVFSARIGRSFLLPNRMRFAGWMGAMRLGLASNTSGSIRLGDAIPGLEDFFENYQSTEWYMNLGGAQQRAVDAIFSEIAANGPGSSTIQYDLEKKLASQWSVVFGGQFQFNPNWMFRAEYAQSVKRGSLLLNLNYRFGL